MELGPEQRRDRTAGAPAHDVSVAPRATLVTRVDFYLEADDRLTIACRLAAKAVQQKLRVVKYEPNSDVAHAIGQMLLATPPIALDPKTQRLHSVTHAPL